MNIERDMKQNLNQFEWEQFCSQEEYRLCDGQMFSKLLVKYTHLIQNHVRRKILHHLQLIQIEYTISPSFNFPYGKIKLLLINPARFKFVEIV